MTRTSSSRRTRQLAAAPLVLASLTPVLAQTAPSSETVSLDAVNIVGSRVKGRTVFDSPVPIDRYNAKEVEQALAATGEVGSALQALSPSINQPRVSASGSADSVRVVQLRGLAPDQVLVLVNGKRRHTNAVLDLEGIFQGTVPVDLNALPGNAIERIEVLRDGAGAQYGSDAVAGVINIVLKGGGTGGSASADVGAYHTHFAPTGRTITDGQTVQLAGDRGWTFANQATLRLGAEVKRQAGTNRAGPSDGQVLFKSGDPQVRAATFFANGVLPLGGGDELYGFATLHRRNSEGAAFFRYPGDPNNVPAIYPQGYRPVTTGEVTDLGTVAGTRVTVGEWSLDASARLGENRYEQGVRQSLNASLGAASPTQFHLATLRAGQTSLNLDASRGMKVFDGRWLNLSVGAEWLHETYRSSAGDPASYAAGTFTDAPPGAQAGPGLQPQDAVSLSRNVGSVYGDAEVDITRNWLVATALRVADYSDAGSSTTGKIATRFKLTPQWLLRGSLSTSFRAPALAQTGFRFATLNFNADGTGLQNNALLPASDVLAQAFGAQALKPETSHHLSLGAAWKSSQGATASIDAYRVRLKDRITRTSDLQSDAVATWLTAHGRTDIQSVAFLTNALDTTTTGIDLSLGQETKLAGGTLQLNAALNLNRTRVDTVRQSSAELAAIDPALTLIGSDALLRVTRGTPRHKLILGADWQGAAWGVGLRATRYGSVWAFSFDGSAPLVDGTPAQRLGNTWVADVDVRYALSPAVTVSLGAVNLFNRYPARTYAGSSYGGAFPYNFTDPTGINGTYWHARLNWKL